MKPKKKHKISRLPCIYFMVAAAGLMILQRFASSIMLLRQLNWLCLYFAGILLAAWIFSELRRWANANPTALKEAHRAFPFTPAGLRKAYKTLREKVKAKQTQLISKIKPQKSAEPSPNEGEESPEEIRPESELPAEFDKPEELSEPMPDEPVADSLYQEPEGWSELAPEGAESIHGEKPEADLRQNQHKVLDALYAVVQLLLTAIFVWRETSCFNAARGMTAEGLSYVHVLLVLFVSVSCFVGHRFTGGAQENRRKTESDLFTLFGMASAGLTVLLAFCVVVRVNTLPLCAWFLEAVSLYAAAAFLFALCYAAVRFSLTLDFNYALIPTKAGADPARVSFLNALETNTGISLKSLWSIRYALTILPALALGFLGVMMLSTCMYKVESYQQAAVYHLGKLSEKSIKGPGLHLKAPWPLSQVELYDVARNQQVPIGYDYATSNDFLWTASHGGEEYSLLLGSGNELVSVNMRIVYTIDDLYHYLVTAADPTLLLSSRGYEIMMNKTVTTNLDTFLNVDRQSMAEEVAAELQSFSNDEQLGFHIESVLIESLHPPVEVSDVYQGVVSADVRRQTLVTNAESKALQTQIKAEENSTTMTSDALAEQYNRTADATQEMAVYLAAFESYSVSPECFLLTKSLSTYEKIIHSQKVYVAAGNVNVDRFVLGAQGQGGAAAVGWSDIEELMDAAEEKRIEQQKKEEAYYSFGWSDDG